MGAGEGGQGTEVVCVRARVQLKMHWHKPLKNSTVVPKVKETDLITDDLAVLYLLEKLLHFYIDFFGRITIEKYTVLLC